MSGEYFYVMAFMRLHTDRPVTLSEGCIPWSSRVAYGEHAGLDGDMVNIFADIIGLVDNIYLEDCIKRKKEETVRQTAQASKPTKGKGFGRL